MPKELVREEWFLKIGTMTLGPYDSKKDMESDRRTLRRKWPLVPVYTIHDTVTETRDDVEAGDSETPGEGSLPI